MKIQCDVCEKAPAMVICCADEAALCGGCDVEIHAANKLASKHQRLQLDFLSGELPRCDICREKAAFIFCVEDRALFCRECDEPLHIVGTRSGDHQRYLATGIRVALSSMCKKDSNDDIKPPTDGHGLAAPAKVPTTPQANISSFMHSAWAVDEFLQLSDHETGDRVPVLNDIDIFLDCSYKIDKPWLNSSQGSPVGFGELEWFEDIDLFHEQTPKETQTAAQVPEIPTQQASNPGFYRSSKFTNTQANNTSFYRANKSSIQFKKPRLEICDEEFFVVPDLG